MSRPTTNIYKFLSPTDNQLLGFLKEAYELEGSENFSVQVAPGINESFDGKTSDVIDSLAKAGKGRQILQATFHGNAIEASRGRSYFIFDRGESVNNILQPSTKFAEILFNSPNLDVKLSAEIANLIDKHFKTSLPISLKGDGGDIGIFVTQLAEISTGIADTLSKSQIDADKKAQERLAKLDEQSAELHKTLKSDRKKLQKTYDDKSNELNAREAELNNARARSERRGLRQSINAALRNSLENEIIPQSARFARYPIIMIAGIGLAFSLYFAFFSFNQFAQLITQLGQGREDVNDVAFLVNSGLINWLFASLFLRGSIGIGAATFFGYYLIRYFKNLEETANRRALDLERYLFDIDRASWVIETIMELKDDEGISTIPEPWLRGTTHNLFGSDGVKNEDTQNPLEALGEILATGAKLKVGNGGGELEIQPKAAKKIAKKSN